MLAITKRGLPPSIEEADANVIFVTTGVISGVTYVSLESIRQYFGNETCTINLNEVIPRHLIKTLGGNGGLEPLIEWINTPIRMDNESQFTNSDGVLSLCPQINLTTIELEEFCVKVFPGFTTNDNYIRHFKEYLTYITNIQNLNKSELNFSIQEMQRLWYNVVKSSDHIPWLAEFIEILIKEPQQQIYHHLHNFIVPFHQNEIELTEIVCLIMNTNSVVKIDKDQLLYPLNNDTRMRIFSYTPPTTNPLQSLLNVQIARISKIKLDDTTIDKERIEALQKILSKNKYNAQRDCPEMVSSMKLQHNLLKNINFKKMFKYPNPVILNYKENEKGIKTMNVFSAYTMFFMEISNRELYDINNTICTIRVHQK